MGYRNDFRTKTRKRGASMKVAWPVKAFRAATALLVFAVPLALGASAVIGYGLCRACKRMKRSR